METRNTQCLISFFGLIGIATLALLTANTFAAPPVIQHDPIPSYPPGQAIPVVVKIDGGGQAIQSVTLAATSSVDSPPIRLPMNDTGGGLFYGEIPASLNVGTQEIGYYVTARTLSDFSETPWRGISIGTPAAVERAAGTGSLGTIGTGNVGTPTTTQPQPAVAQQPPPGGAPAYDPAYNPAATVPEPAMVPEDNGNKKKKWTWIGAGAAALAVGAAVVLANDDDDDDNTNDSPAPAPDASADGDSDTDAGTDPNADGSGGTDTTDSGTPSTDDGSGDTDTPEPTILNRAANDSVRASILVFPVATTIDHRSDFDGKTLVSTDINLAYDPADGFADRFQILFDNNLVFDSGPVSTAGNASVNIPGGDGQVIIAVPSSLRDTSGVFNYSWAASLVYRLE